MKSYSLSRISLHVLLTILAMATMSCAAPATPGESAAPAPSGEEMSSVTPLPGVLRLPLGTQQVNGDDLFSAIGPPALCTAPDRGQPLSELNWFPIEPGSREFYPDGYELTSEYVNDYGQRFRLAIGAPTQEPVDTYVSQEAGVKVCLEATQSPQPPPDISVPTVSTVDIWDILVAQGYNLNNATPIVVDEIIAAYVQGTLQPEDISPAFGDTLSAEDIRAALDAQNKDVLARWFGPLIEMLIGTEPEDQPLIISMEWLDLYPDPEITQEYWAVHYLFDPPLPITIKKEVQQFKAKCQTAAWVQIEAKEGRVWDWFWIANLGPQWAYAHSQYYPLGYYSTEKSYLYANFYPKVTALDTSVQGLGSSNTFYIKGGWTVGADDQACRR